MLALIFFHRNERLQNRQTIPRGKAVCQSQRLGQKKSVPERLARRAKIPFGLLQRVRELQIALVREAPFELRDRLLIGKGRELQLHGAAADRRQQLFRARREDQKHRVLGRFFENFEQRVLRRRAQILPARDDIDLFSALVWSDEHVASGLPDNVDRDVLVLRVVDRDHVRVLLREDLAARGANAAAGLPFVFTFERRRHLKRQRPSSRALHAAKKIAVRGLALPEALLQTPFQRVIAEKCAKVHPSAPSRAI